jgi:Ras-related C3 botulinum toxin substrate 1
VASSVNVFYVSGQEGYDQLRRQAYKETSIFLVCFSVVHPESFLNVLDKWIPEIRKSCPDVPVILVGTKIDLRKDKKVISRNKSTS